MSREFNGQFGEDVILARMLARTPPGVCVEVGANDGVTGSVTLHFERKGWTCVLVEPNPELCRRLRRERNAFVFEGAASSAAGTTTLMLAEGGDLSHAVSSIEPGAEVGIKRQGLSARAVEVKTARLDDILQEARIVPGAIAFVSIDVEGHEHAVLEGFDLARWRPRILLIEDNSILLGGGVRKALAAHGYVRFRRTGVNDWYAAAGDVEVLGHAPERQYLITMVAARGLMIRRAIFRKLLTAPLLGPVLGSWLRAARGRPHG